MSEQSRIADPGLQAERTALAWARTGLAMLVNAALALRAAWIGGHAAVAALAVALFIAAVATALCGIWRGRRLVSGEGSIAPPTIAVAGVAWVTLLACIASVVAVVPSD